MKSLPDDCSPRLISYQNTLDGGSSCDEVVFYLEPMAHTKVAEIHRIRRMALVLSAGARRAMTPPWLRFQERSQLWFQNNTTPRVSERVACSRAGETKEAIPKLKVVSKLIYLARSVRKRHAPAVLKMMMAPSLPRQATSPVQSASLVDFQTRSALLVTCLRTWS